MRTPWRPSWLSSAYTDPEAAVIIKHFFDEHTWTLTYLVYDPDTRDAVVIDPVLDYDPIDSRTSTEQLEKLSAEIRRHQLKLHYVLETHAHADHLSGSQVLRRWFGAQVVIGHNIRKVQQTFKGIFDLPASFATDGSQFDLLLSDYEELKAGSLTIKALPTPGHTPACMSYRIGDAVFTGDALFMEDYGTGRCDFPAGSADALYHSVHEVLYRLPDATRVFVGHDYLPEGRELRFETTIGRAKAGNAQLRQDTSRSEFVAFRNQRDAELKAPKLLFQSVQVNIDAGRLPGAHENGLRYFRIPFNLKQPTDDAGLPLPAKAAQ